MTTYENVWVLSVYWCDYVFLGVLGGSMEVLGVVVTLESLGVHMGLSV